MVAASVRLHLHLAQVHSPPGLCRRRLFHAAVLLLWLLFCLCILHLSDEIMNLFISSYWTPLVEINMGHEVPVYC